MAIFEANQVLPNVLTTGVGSLPHKEASKAVDLILESLSGAAHAPQLPRVDPREQMWIQYTEGLPRFRADFDSLHYYFDTSGDPVSDVEAFFSGYLSVMDGNPPDGFAIGPDYAQGTHVLLERLKQEGQKRPFIKVQVTGPLSFALTLTDESRKPIFYHPMFRDVAVKGIGLKAIWLVEQFRPFAENVIVFFDEPGLSAYGSSAMLGVSKADVVESLDEVISMTVEHGGIPGVHCCGNTDWSLLMETSTRIINFDAVDYMETVAIYARQLADFLGRGGVLAWGAVPNSPRVEQETADDVRARIKAGIDLLEKAGVDRALLSRNVMITPACGCAGITVTQAEKVYGILADLDRRGLNKHL